MISYNGGKNKMTNLQRMKSDIETIDRREMTDKKVENNRNRNDKLTRKRRYKADKFLGENRARNDEITANRRNIKDGNMGMALAISVLILVVLTAGVFFTLL